MRGGEPACPHGFWDSSVAGNFTPYSNVHVACPEQNAILIDALLQTQPSTCTKTLRTASRDPTLRHSKRCARAAHHGRSTELQPEPASVRRRRRLNATRCLPSGRNRSAAPPRRCRGTGPRPDASLRFWRSDEPDVERAKRSRRAPLPRVRLAMHGSRHLKRRGCSGVAHANTKRNHDTRLRRGCSRVAIVQHKTQPRRAPQAQGLFPPAISRERC